VAAFTGTGARIRRNTHAGKYLADRFTDQRRTLESEAADRRRLKDLEAVMPALLKEIQNDLRADSSRTMRKFVLLPNDRIQYTHPEPRFVYYESEHPDARNQIGRLCQAGFADALSSTEASMFPLFRITERFVRLVSKRR
jgi:hypothetical protein